MILEFKIQNYRSYKNQVTFSMVAESSKQKSGNIFEVDSIGRQPLRVLKTSAIFGANASGKTNLLRALYELILMIVDKPKVNQGIKLHQPFLFDLKTSELPSTFELTFIGPLQHKYVYSISISHNAVLEEKLVYYPNNKITLLFERETGPTEEGVHIGRLGSSLGNRAVNVFSNQLILSKFGEDPDPLLTQVFVHFSNYTVINAINHEQKDDLQRSVTEELYNNKNLMRKVGVLVRAADTKIRLIDIDKATEPSLQDNPDISKILRRDPYQVYAYHDLYDGDDNYTRTGVGFNIKNESRGSQMLYSLGGKVLSTIEKGGLLVVDEMDTSLHPYVTKLIVMIFLSERINKNRAQLIFTTHDTSLLEKDFLRKDQVWFTEKKDNGATDLFSLQDFDGLREDTPFDKWYMAGKFGAIPNIESLENLFDNDETSK